MGQPSGPNRLIPPTELPLRASGSQILGASGRVIRLFCVNWYGLHLPSMVLTGLDKQPVDHIAATIAELGFNCVRLPYSLDTLHHNGTIPNASQALAANNALISKSPLEQLDAALTSLTNIGIAVVLNNHVSSSSWCCGFKDDEGLWYTRKYPEQKWFESISVLSQRYQSNPFVVGFDLRNELRPSDLGTPTFGGPEDSLDWSKAASKATQIIYNADPGMLVIVAGLFYNMFLCDVPSTPLHLTLPEQLRDRIVYTAHEYDMTSIPLQAEKLLFGPWLGFLVIGHLVAFVVYLPVGCAKASTTNPAFSGAAATEGADERPLSQTSQSLAYQLYHPYQPHPHQPNNSHNNNHDNNHNNHSNNSHCLSQPPSPSPPPLPPSPSASASAPSSSSVSSSHFHAGMIAATCPLSSGMTLPRTHTLSSADSAGSPRDFRQPLMGRNWACGSHRSIAWSRRCCSCRPAVWCDLLVVLVCASVLPIILSIGGGLLPSCGIYGNPLLPGLLFVLFSGLASVLLWLRYALGTYASFPKCQQAFGTSSFRQNEPSHCRLRGCSSSPCVEQGLFTPLSPPGAELTTIVETGESSVSLPSVAQILSGPTGSGASRFGLNADSGSIPPPLSSESPGVRSAAIGAPVSPIDSPPSAPQLQDPRGARAKEAPVVNVPAPFDIAPITPPPTDLPISFSHGLPTGRSTGSPPRMRDGSVRPWLMKLNRWRRSAPLCQGIFSLLAFVSLSWVGLPLSTYETFESDLDARWGFLMKNQSSSALLEGTSNPRSTAPVWLGEFGTVEDTRWWEHLMRYMREREVSFAYWSINGDPQHPYMAVLNQDSKTVQRSWKLKALQALMADLDD